MINFAGKTRVYIDTDVFLASNAEKLFQLFAQRHIQMVLCVDDEQEEAEMKKHELFDYIAYTLYRSEYHGLRLIEDIAIDRKIPIHKCMAIMGDSHHWMMDLDQVDAIVEYGSVEHFIKEKFLHDRILFVILTLIQLLSAYIITQIGYHGVFAIPFGFMWILICLVTMMVCFMIGLFFGVFTTGTFLSGMMDWWWMT